MDLARATETGADGRYRFDNVPPGTHQVLAMQAGLDSEAQIIEVGPGGTGTVDIALRITPVRTEITVTATEREETAFRAVQSLTSMDAFDLSESISTSIGEVLDGQSGIAKRSFGTGSARPVIRGFDGDRVLVMQDGVGIGSLGSQSGDHSEPIDESTVGARRL